MTTIIVRQRKEGEPKILSNGEPVIFAEGKIGAIIHYPVLVDEGHGYTAKTFEKFVRSPGTRVIALKEGKVYLQKEARMEKEGYDWRLPGGKVVDTFAEYKTFLTSPIPKEKILEAARKEFKEEAGLEAGSVEIFTKDVCGATVEWDLYYVVARDVVAMGARSAHSEGEDIISAGWFAFDDVKKMCDRGEISEGRSVAVLLRFISEQK